MSCSNALSTASSMWVWIEQVIEWLAADSSSPAEAEDVLKLLFKAVPKFILETVRP